MTRRPDRRLFITFLPLALLAVALVLLLRPTSAPYLDLLRQGDAHAATAERTAAVAAYREAALLRPRDPAPYLRLAQVYLDWGRTADALAAVTQAERLAAGEGGGSTALTTNGSAAPTTNGSTALTTSGSAALTTGGSTALTTGLERLWVAIHVARADWPAVVEHARRLLPLTPAEALDDASAVRHTLARAYVELEEWDAARAEYEILLRADPADSVAHERLGASLLGDDDAVAIQHLSAAGTGLAYRLIATLGEAATVDDPAYADALLGQALFQEQEWALAARLFERALSHNPYYPDVHAYLGYALDQMGRSDEAGTRLQQAVALAPDSAVAHIFLGLHYDRAGDFSAARAEYETAYDLDPDNPATCVEIGQTWAAERRYVAAEIWLREAVNLQPDDPALWEVLARFYLDHNMTAEGQGVDAAKELVALSPDDARAHDLRGWAALQIGDHDTARGSLLRAISLDPSLASAHYHLGLLWELQGMHQEAREEFIRALDMDTTGDLVPLVERSLSTIY